MSPDPGPATRGLCAAVTGCPDTGSPFCRYQFMTNLSATLGQRTEIVPLRLPQTCACLWLGYTGLDRIGFNPDWPHPAGPGDEITLTAHAIGHLVLGHCGSPRDGGQFACLPVRAELAPADRDQLRRLLHDPIERLSRLFSDAEEQDADTFAARLGDRLAGRRTARTRGPGNGFACIG
jgi:hypothetical protein